MHEENAMLRVRAWGRDTPRVPAPACSAILGEIRRLGLKRILFELEQKVPLSSASQYEMVDRMPALGITPQHRIALVHYTPGLYEATDLLETAAVNRGLSVKNFRDLPAALAWLG